MGMTAWQLSVTILSKSPMCPPYFYHDEPHQIFLPWLRALHQVHTNISLRVWRAMNNSLILGWLRSRSCAHLEVPIVCSYVVTSSHLFVVYGQRTNYTSLLVKYVPGTRTHSFMATYHDTYSNCLTVCVFSLSIGNQYQVQSSESRATTHHERRGCYSNHQEVAGCQTLSSISSFVACNLSFGCLF